MPEFIETSDISFTICEAISAVTTYTFTNNRGKKILLRQFILNVDADVVLTWDKNIGTYNLKAGESLVVPVRVNSITITPSGSTNIRLIGIG